MRGSLGRFINREAQVARAINAVRAMPALSLGCTAIYSRRWLLPIRKQVWAQTHKAGEDQRGKAYAKVHLGSQFGTAKAIHQERMGFAKYMVSVI